jgi:signal transduction histidine kinase
LKERHWGKIAGLITAILLFFTVVFTATFYLTSLVTAYTGYRLPLIATQILDSVLGLILGGLILSGVAVVLRSLDRDLEAPIFAILAALGRIAQGDFDVRLDDRLHDNLIVGELVKSVNNVALELGRLEEMRREFVSNVSHEIQSPLTSIRGFAQALDDDELSPSERHHYLAIIETESTRLSRLTDNLLRLASLDAQQTKLEPRPYRLDRQLRDLILSCEPQWTAKRLELDVALDEVVIVGDEDLLSQVWLNLIHNSIKFTPGDGNVRVELRQRDRQAEVRVSDTGIGITDEDRARVFERFYKADKSRERALGGSGLGLAIAKKIVDLHSGTIELQSQVSVGTTVVVSLPVE